MGGCWVPYKGSMSQWLAGQGRVGSALRHIVGLACAAEVEPPSLSTLGLPMLGHQESGWSTVSPLTGSSQNNLWWSCLITALAVHVQMQSLTTYARRHPMSSGVFVLFCGGGGSVVLSSF